MISGIVLKTVLEETEIQYKISNGHWIRKSPFSYHVHVTVVFILFEAGSFNVVQPDFKLPS